MAVVKSKPTPKIKRDTSRDYVNNAKMYEALVARRPLVQAALAAGLEKPRVSEYLGACLWKISENLARRSNFAGYSFKDEMIADAIENCIMYIDTFDPEKTKNPFSYFTLTVWRAFVRRIQKEKKQTYIKMRVQESAMVNDSLVDNGSDAAHFDSPYLNLDYDKMGELERSLKVKRKRGSNAE